jgi:hypothetical protein
MTPGSATWSPARRLASRFVLFYLAFYVSPFDLSDESDGGVTKGLVSWTGARLGLDVAVLPNGSGDTTYNYVQVLCLVVLALVAAVAFSLVERRGRWDSALFAALRVWIRYVLGYTMLTYGAFKVWKTQFPFPSPETLVLPFGEASPMRLLWTFMGYSAAYTMFAGASEMLGGLLLLFRRTTLLGALVSAGVLANVVMLNFSYDVPVKLYSFHLLLLAVFLVAPDVTRLVRFFLRNQPVPPAPERRPLGPKLERARVALKILVAGAVVFGSMNAGYRSWRNYGDAAPKPPLYGLWDVEQFDRDGVPVPPLATDKTRWRRVMIGSFVMAYPMDESKRSFRLKVDEAARTLELIKPRGTVGTFHWERPDADTLHLVGTLDDTKVEMRLRRRDENSFLLVNRGFHWVNEYPFN